MKKIAMFLCLLFIFGSSQAAVAVRMQDGAALIERDGAVIVPVGAHEDIVSLGRDLFAAGDGHAWALMDDSGILLTDFLYDDLRWMEAAVLAERDGMLGLLNASGDEISAFEYTRMIPGTEGAFWAVKGDPDDMESDELFIVDARGERATECYVRQTGEAGEGMIAVLMPENGMWGYCNSEGEPIISAAYSHAAGFVSGRAAVVQNDQYGAIDRSGKLVVPAAYDFLQVSPAGFILAARNMQGVCLLDLDGNEIAAYPGEDVFGALLGDGYAVYGGDRLQLYDARGNLMEETAWDASVTEGLNGQLIIAEGAWGEQCVHLNGTDALWQNLYPLGTADGQAIYACMQVNAARYVNDLLGEIQYAVDMENARYGVADAGGEALLPCEYETIEYLEDDRLLAYAEGLWQMIDCRGNIYWQHGARQTEAPSDAEYP